jgi:phage host-nuclease inhibitor protein Gam
MTWPELVETLRPLGFRESHSGHQMYHVGEHDFRKVRSLFSGRAEVVDFGRVLFEGNFAEVVEYLKGGSKVSKLREEFMGIYEGKEDDLIPDSARGAVEEDRRRRAEEDRALTAAAMRPLKRPAPQEEENEGAAVVPSFRGEHAPECVHGYEKGQCSNAGCVAAPPAIWAGSSMAYGGREDPDDMVTILEESGVDPAEARRVVAEADAKAREGAFHGAPGAWDPATTPGTAAGGERDIGPEEEAPPGWTITNRDGLERALKRMGELQAELAQKAESYAKERAQLDERFSAICKPLGGLLEGYRQRAEVYAAEHREELLGSGKRKTWDGMNGSISFRDRESDGWRLMEGVENRRALVEWAQKRERPPQAPPLVRPGEPQPDLDEIKAYLFALGRWAGGAIDNPPGLEFVPRGTTISVKPAKRGGR